MSPVWFHNHAPWFVVRRTVRVVAFSDETFAVGWRWSKRARLCS